MYKLHELSALSHMVYTLLKKKRTFNPSIFLDDPDPGLPGEMDELKVRFFLRRV